MEYDIVVMKKQNTKWNCTSNDVETRELSTEDQEMFATHGYAYHQLDDNTVEFVVKRFDTTTLTRAIRVFNQDRND